VKSHANQKAFPSRHEGTLWFTYISQDYKAHSPLTYGENAPAGILSGSFKESM